jgi:hypothetical protein
MNVYSDDQERAIRVMRLVNDWTRSDLLSQQQRDHLAPELRVDLRRTNKFLRATLFVFGLIILLSIMGLLAFATGVREEATFALLAAFSAVVCVVIANQLVDRFRLYRFGIEEAAAVAGVGFAIASAAVLALAGGFRDDGTAIAGLVAGCFASFAIFMRFGYVYAAIASMIFAAALPFVPGDSDMIHRLVSITILVVIFAVVRSLRNQHGREYPGDSYAIVEAAAWVGIYLVTNLQLSSWISHPEDRTPFYWATYVATWVLPAIGLWIAVRDRHRALLDVNAVMAIATLMTNKAYLGTARHAYDPIAFGVLLIAIAVGLRRWLASGEGGSRHGFIAERILESEKERLGVAGTLSVVHQGPVASHPQPDQPPPPAIGGGGASGGAGATGSF